MVHIPPSDPRQHDRSNLDMTEIPEIDPFVIFSQWYDLACEREHSDPNAFTLATLGTDGFPDGRILLFKHLDHQGLVFYTNLQSAKGQALAQNPKASAIIHWKSILRQIRIKGVVTQVSDEEADAYFHSRPRDSQIGAWVSQQSRPLDGRQTLEKALEATQKRFEDQEVIPRPNHWSGLRLTPQSIEFWKNGPYRLHFRRVFSRRDNHSWESHILYP